LVPGDSLGHYIRQLWETIHANRELNVPSQRSLLSHFKCEEVVKEELSEFAEFAEPLELRLDRGDLINDFYGAFADQVTARLSAYRQATVRYLTPVVQESEVSLINGLFGVILPLFERHRELWSKRTETEFAEALERLGPDLEEKKPWLDGALHAKSALIRQFTEATAVPKGSPEFPFALKAGRKKVEAILDGLLEARRRDLVARLCQEVVRSAQRAFELEAVKLFRESAPGLWKALGDGLARHAEAARARISEILADACPGDAIDCELIATSLQDTFTDLNRDAYEVLETRLRVTFERYFNRTPDDFVRVWGEGDDVDHIGCTARDAALAILQIYYRPTLPQLSVNDTQFEVTLPRAQKAAIEIEQYRQMLALFQLETDRAMETAKTLVQAHTRVIAVPNWAWFLLLIMGWTQVMWLMEHPVLAVLVFGLGGLLYLLYQFNILTPLLNALKDRFVDFVYRTEEEDMGEPEPAQPEPSHQLPKLEDLPPPSPIKRGHVASPAAPVSPPLIPPVETIWRRHSPDPLMGTPPSECGVKKRERNSNTSSEGEDPLMSLRKNSDAGNK
jgi:hypothetical protein